MNKLLFLIIFISSLISCQEKKSDFKITQFEGTEKNGQISKEVKYNDNGQIKFAKLTGFKTTKYISSADFEETYFYKDTLLIKTLIYYPNSIDADSARTEYRYNNKNQLIERAQYDYKKRLKKTLEFGDCLIDSTDYEPQATWKLESRIEYKYDDAGRKIEYYAPETHWDSQNHYYYEYNSQDCLIKETSLNDNKLIWEKHFDYLENGYDYFYNRLPITKIENKSDWPYFYKVRYVKDNKGNILEESEKGKDGTLNYRIIREFKNNRIINEKRYNRNNDLELTYIYDYE
ncbi:hypothetical protein [Aequorivita capsosiphonis]|uniref:hypothetical protein n=1 Tax=Aequorivita capsosiphonis TaxID=487317 RepID=UPI00047A9223|nr:hypothetical protein [Aequorivita capsosiphonis]